ncbi:TIM-barrel domain-containing protein [Chitinophaga sedimenti]|uniref:TIM-barrel domain-containing protein n=1 Tax=Chitinophaga sedimenti TaxID=2033606 RepID=UPI00249F7969|nr:TIM-barrel domain-containing protein [Chitinophaga sedimenti]
MARLLILIVMFSCRATAGHIEKLPDGLIVFLKQPPSGGARQVKLQVVSEKIIHVTASAEDTFSQTPSLMVVTSGVPGVKWESLERPDEVVLKTAVLSASVQLSSGIVTFRDAAGNILLKEAAKSFKPVEFGGKDLYQVKQSFLSPENEAFYGLGQPQTGLINYKDKDVDLTQYNAIAAVPFLVSSRNYGILWDNYSITKFGDDRAPRPIGELGALTADYSVNGKVHTSRPEQQIDYTYIASLDALPAGFPLDKGKVTWEGVLKPQENGRYKFYTTSSGYIKIWVDGQLRLDRWRESWNPGPSIIEQSFTANTPHQLKIEWIPESAQSFFSFKWLGPSRDLKDKMSLSSEAAEKIDYYFVYGKQLDEVISGYRTLTGKASLLPQWALGFWQSRERYKTQAEILQTVKTFRDKKIPLDNIVLDWSYWKEDAWGSQEFDEKRFPDAKGMIDQLHRQYNTHFMISVWPKFYEGISNYKKFEDKGWLYKQNIADRQRDWIGKGYVSTFYDAYHPGARSLFWQLMNEHLFSKGVDAWWLDASEPDIYSNSSIEHRKS